MGCEPVAAAELGVEGSPGRLTGAREGQHCGASIHLSWPPCGLAHGLGGQGSQGALWPRCPHLYSGLGQVRAQSQLFPGIYIRVVGFLEDFLQFLQLERAEGCAVPALLALILGQLHGVRESRGQRDTQTSQAGAWGAWQIRGPVSGAPSAVQGQLGEAGSFGGLLLSCNGKHKEEDGKRTRGFCGWNGGRGKNVDASVPASPFLFPPSSQQPPFKGAWHSEACLLSLQLGRGPWGTMCSVVWADLLGPEGGSFRGSALWWRIPQSVEVPGLMPQQDQAQGWEERVGMPLLLSPDCRPWLLYPHAQASAPGPAKDKDALFSEPPVSGQCQILLSWCRKGKEASRGIARFFTDVWASTEAPALDSRRQVTGYTWRRRGGEQWGTA